MSIIVDWYKVGLMFYGAGTLSAGLMIYAVVKEVFNDGETNERKKFLIIFIICIIMSLILTYITK